MTFENEDELVEAGSTGTPSTESAHQSEDRTERLSSGPHQLCAGDLAKLKSMADEARSAANRTRELRDKCRAAGWGDLEIATARSEIAALRAESDALRLLEQIKNSICAHEASEASVVTNAELLSFLDAYTGPGNYGAKLALRYRLVPSDEVSRIRSEAFNVSVGTAVKRHLASRSKSNLAPAASRARQKKAKQASEIIRARVAEIRRARGPSHVPAEHIAEHHLDDINDLLQKDVGLTYTEQTLCKKIREIDR
jgi:hypothetical protein